MIRLLTLLGLLIAASASSDERLERLPKKYRDWIEKEVVYVISDKEREAFLDLEAEQEWEAFMDAFWRRRDPDPLTPVNEFREEHYARIEYVNQYFGRESAVPGWMTDRGKMFIILGKPRDREDFTSVPSLYPAELWSYDANREKGLPPLYLLFFQEYHAGPYRLFNHLLDGPEDLMPAQPLDPNDSRRMAYEILQEINPALAHSTITMRADQGAAAGILQPERSSLDFQALLSDIYVSPFRRVDTRYVDEGRAARGLVETEYLFNYVPSWGMANVLPGPSGTSFVHYMVEIEARHMTVARDPSKNVYYTSFELKSEVTTADEQTVVASFSKEPYVQLTESQFREVGSRPFAYRDMFPLTSGEFRFRLVLKNRARSEYTIFEAPLVVPEPAGNAPFVGEPVILYGMSRIGGEAGEEASFYRTYRLGKVVLEPNAKRTVAIGDYLMAHVPVENAGDDFTLRARVFPQEVEGGAPLVEEEHELDFYERPVVLRMPLTGVDAGRYRLEVELRAPGGRALSSRSTEFAVSPLSEISRPWGLRDSLEGERAGLVRAALAAQEMRLGRKERARELLEEAVALDPNATSARLLLARLRLDEGKLSEAIRLLEPARAQAPKDVEILLALGDAHIQSGNFARAVELFEAAAALRRPDTALLNALAISHERLGHREQAVSYLKRSLEIDPDQESVKSLLEGIEKR